MLDLSLLDNPIENIFVLRKWNWDYLEAQSFQLECVDYVYKNPHVTILIICSHPHCFTLGRGLQKLKDTTQIELVDFDSTYPLSYPLYQIKRGGGLTFHYPGQFVLYPIMNLTIHKKAVFDVMIKIMEVTKALIEKQFDLKSLVIKRDLLGLWFEDTFVKAKVASIGLAVTRYNTYHGLALNFFNDQKMFQELSHLHPCGLSGLLYKDLESLKLENFSLLKRDEFADDFLLNILNYLIIDKQRSSSLISDSIS
jgi:lipoate-protein ligase B